MGICFLDYNYYHDCRVIYQKITNGKHKTMPLSFTSYGPIAFVVLAGIVIINEIIKHIKKGHHHSA